MGLVDRIAARQSDEVERSDPVTMEEFGYLLGRGSGNATRTKAGVTMGPRAALGITAWYSGVRYIAETMAGLPAPVFRDRSGERESRALPPWRVKPDAESTWFSLVEFWVMSLLHKGNAYAFKLRDPVSGQVVGLRMIHPDRVRVGQANGLKVFELDSRTDVAYTTREILHIPGLSYDGIVGLNPLQYHADALGTIAASEEFAGRSFGQGTMDKAYLSVPQKLDKGEAEALGAVWQAQHAGLVNAGKLAVIGGGGEYKTIGLDPVSTQLLESRKYGVTEVSRLLRIPPHKLYDLDRATFSNIEQQSIEAVTDGIRPWCTRIEAWVNDDPDLMPPGNFLEFNLEGLLRGDLKSRMEAYSAGVAAGVYMPSEPRRKENLPHIEGSDVLFRPLNMEPYGPGAASTDGHDAAELAQIIQKLYLGVDVVLTAAEARAIVGLTGDLPRPALPPGAPA